MQDNWQEFEEAFADYGSLRHVTCNNFRQTGKEMPVEELASLGLAMGSEARQVLKLNISLIQDECKSPEVVVSKMRDYYMGSKTVIFERFKFNKAVQGASESIATSDTRLRLRDLAKSCDYGALTEQVVRDIH